MLKTILLLLILFVPTLAQVKLVPYKITLKNGKAFELNLPAEYEIIPAAEGLKRVRFFAKSPDGRIFVTDMYDLTDNAKGTVYILDGFDSQTGKFSKISTYLTNLKNPNSVQFYKDEKGQDWLYLAETDRLTRRKFTKGETAPTDTKPQTLATFPDYGLSYKYGGWHLTRTIAFSPNGKLYVSVGSSCNACKEKEAVRASVLEMNADGSEQRTFAKGLRNAIDLKWIGKFLFATNQGADHLGSNKPDETFYALRDGADYGWASCYQSNGKVYADSEHRRREGCENVPASYAYFPAHSSAMGFDYFDETTNGEMIKNSFLVALHGSTDKKIGSGYKIVIMRKGEENQDFINGFLQGKTVVGRPCGIMKLDENSFLFTDDFSGVIYYVRRRDSTMKIAAAPEAQENLVENSENANTKQPESTTKSGNCLGVVVVLFGIFLRLIF
ncbi:MAG: glucose/sorbosone dehydrogenase [Acidobacteriota bacterium]|nr:glucose/sorbosone dehydrogenase [Acidobacteriota bacterium]